MSWTGSGFWHEVGWIGLNPSHITMLDSHKIKNYFFDCSSIVRDNNEGRAAIEERLERYYHKDGVYIDAYFETKHRQNVVDNRWKKFSHEWNCCLKEKVWWIDYNSFGFAYNERKLYPLHIWFFEFKQRFENRYSAQNGWSKAYSDKLWSLLWIITIGFPSK